VGWGVGAGAGEEQQPEELLHHQLLLLLLQLLVVVVLLLLPIIIILIIIVIVMIIIINKIIMIVIMKGEGAAAVTEAAEEAEVQAVVSTRRQPRCARCSRRSCTRTCAVSSGSCSCPSNKTQTGSDNWHRRMRHKVGKVNRLSTAAAVATSRSSRRRSRNG